MEKYPPPPPPKTKTLKPPQKGQKKGGFRITNNLKPPEFNKRGDTKFL
jgi:hypothetical protein